MAEIIFFEKAGCSDNSKQKNILYAAGHALQAVDLMKHPWTEDELLLFFSKLQVKDWFNKSAPSVQSGKLIPENFNRPDALEALQEDHILIRRPLLIIGNKTFVGFDSEKLEELIGLQKIENPEMATL